MLRPFVSGQKIRKLPTRALNEAIDFSQKFELYGERSNPTPRRGQFEISIHNATGDDLDQWAAVGFSNPVIDPADNERSFRDRIAFDAETPTHDDHLDAFAVLTKPLRDGQVGKAMLSGWLNCKVDVVNVEHQFVRPKDGTAELETCGAGGGQILWPGPFADTGEQWATISLEPFAGTGFAYLKGNLNRATVTGTPKALTPAQADATIYTFDSSGVWATMEDDIQINNPWEGVSAPTGSLVSFVMHKGKWMLTGVSCDPTQLDL